LASSAALKRSNSRLANNKLVKISIACRCKVLLVCRFDTEGGELDGVFKAGLSSGFADKVLDVVPLWKANVSKAREGRLIV
jgi:hypothetical protein